MADIKIVLADDHTIVRKGIRSLLDEEPDIEVVGEAENGHEAVETVARLQPDVAILDIGMPSLNGLEATKLIKKAHPGTHVLILTMHDNEEYIAETLKAGASGYLIKKSAPRELINAIRVAFRGETYLSPSISTKVVNRFIRISSSVPLPDTPGDSALTPREREIIQLIAEGFSNKEIADKLFISAKTVKNHRSNLMEKLDLHNTAEITQYAIRKGIVILDSL